jgi:hypothetical protein
VTQKEWTKVRRVVEDGIDKIVERLNDEEMDVGYWPEDNTAFVDAVMAVLRHQRTINDYHNKNSTQF